MYAINKFARCTWEYIATLGKVLSVEARDSHYVEVTYEYLTTLGVQHFHNNKETVYKSDLVIMAGFSISYNSTDSREIEIRTGLLARSQTIVHVSAMTKTNLSRLHGIMKTDTDNVKYDLERGSHAMSDGINVFVVYGAGEQYSWADALLDARDEYYKRLNMNRVLWYKWLQEAKFTEHHTGDLFKFPNGLSVKFDNKEEQVAATGDRMFCETYDHNKEITRFYNEEDFLVWLTIYF
jgi:hypothetical protein